jgi:N-acetylmuramoyl-L-alanine amidase
MKIALFPGHAGKDSGATDGINGIMGDTIHSVEVAITSQIVSKVALFLGLLGIEYTIGIGKLRDRVMNTADCDAGISVHADMCSDENVHGFHVMCWPESQGGMALATSVDVNLALTEHRARQVHGRRDLYILRETNFPCVLVECGFLSNDTDECHLMVEGHQYRLAWAMVQGLREWMARL